MTPEYLEDRQKLLDQIATWKSRMNLVVMQYRDDLKETPEPGVAQERVEMLERFLQGNRVHQEVELTDE